MRRLYSGTLIKSIRWRWKDKWGMIVTYGKTTNRIGKNKKDTLAQDQKASGNKAGAACSACRKETQKILDPVKAAL